MVWPCDKIKLSSPKWFRIWNHFPQQRTSSLSQPQPTLLLPQRSPNVWQLLLRRKEVVWARRILFDLGFSQPELSPLFSDNQSAIRLVHNPKFHKRSKHIDAVLPYSRISSLWWNRYLLCLHNVNWRIFSPKLWLRTPFISCALHSISQVSELCKWCFCAFLEYWVGVLLRLVTILRL